MIEQFAVVVAALTVADPYRLVAATVFVKDHALQFLPINKYLISFCKYSTYMYKYDKDYIILTQLILIVVICMYNTNTHTHTHNN